MAGDHGLSGGGWGSGRGSTQSSRPHHGPWHRCCPLELSGTRPWALGGVVGGGRRGQTGAPGPHPVWGSPLGQAHGEGRPVWGDPSGPLAVTVVLWGPSPSPPLPPPSFCPHRGSCQDGPSLMPCLGKDLVGTQHVRSVARPALMVASLPGLARLWVSGSCSLHDPAALPPSQRCSRGPASGPAREWAHGG